MSKALVVIAIQNDITKNYRGIIDQINAAIDELKADGTFDELVKTYIEAE